MASTAWRSPLSILMGARRNDDADLELREDYLYRRFPAAAAPPPSSPPRASTATNDGGPKTVEQQPKSSSSSGLSSYLPFSYFGLTSPAPKATMGQNGAGDNHLENNNGEQQPYAPPMGAFPPNLSESQIMEDDGQAAVDDYILEEQRQHDELDDRQYSSSHPWFNQVELVDPSDNGLPNQPDNFGDPNNANAKKRYLTWADQKAIIGTTFNFTNSIIGAGAMGLGGAFAASGGGISVLMLIGFAFLTKASLDLVVDLSSCPMVIKKARSRHEHRENESVDDMSLSSGSGSSSDEDSDESDDATGKNNPFEDILGMIDESKNSDVEQTTQDDDTLDSKKILDVEETREESSTKKANDNSPLMATEEEKDASDDIEDAYKTPTKSAGLNNNDQPLIPSLSEQVNKQDRYDLLTMDVTAPRHFSPLDLSPEPKPSFSIPSENHIQQRYERMPPCTYEELGHAAFGTMGRLAVLLSKALYSSGCLVAYVVVVRDNFGLALRRIWIGPSSPNFVSEHENNGYIYDDDFLAFWVSALCMLPLSCPRTMKPLAKFSFVSVLSIIFLVLVVIYLFFTCTNPEGGINGKSSFYENWIEIRSLSGFVESLGCFVFTFVCHHTVNLAYETLPMPIRNPKVWRRVSTNSMALALEASLAIGVFAYLTFGSQTPADVLMGYPADLTLANIARLLLCLTMVLTFPLPFLTCREMIVLIFLDMHSFYHIYKLERINPLAKFCKATKRQSIPTETGANENVGDEAEIVHMQLPSFFSRWRRNRRGFRTANVGPDETNEDWWGGINDNGAVTQALLSEEEHETEVITSICGSKKGKVINPSPLSSQSGELSSTETTISSVVVPVPSWVLPRGDGRQLAFIWHAILTFTLWLVVTVCAIKSPSLGDVLDLVGAFTGTLLAFILPALFSFKLKGYSHLSLAILAIGGVVGLLGSIFSMVKFARDIS